MVVYTWTRDVKVSTLHSTIHCAVTVHREEGRSGEERERERGRTEGKRVRERKRRERVDMLYIIII